MQLFPRLNRIWNRHYDLHWENKEPKTFEEQLDYWLYATPMQGIFYSNLPYQLPHEQRFAGMWLPLPPGMGKTNVLNGLIQENLPDEFLRKPNRISRLSDIIRAAISSRLAAMTL
jgi:hypothetical protein